MKNLSLKTRIMFQALIISAIVPIVSGLIVYRNNQTATVYQEIANDTLLKVEKLGELQGHFRQIRIEVRSLAVMDNTKEENEKYISDTLTAIAKFESSKGEIEKLFVEDDEKKQLATLHEKWVDFKSFGQNLVAKARARDEASLKSLSHDVRVICPVKKEGVEKIILDLVEQQKAQSKELVSKATKSEETTGVFAIVGILSGLCIAVLIGTIFAARVNKALGDSIRALADGVDEINKKSNATADVSEKITGSSNQQASSIQSTVTSIDQISAMVSRNADSAVSAAKTSEIALRSAQKGKENAAHMLQSINTISEGNEEVIKQMEKTNREISEIVKIIQEISQKTQVINDIVLQTKMLSFNASVESARAGEHGKGFSVVAEEVGNLASLSGKAADEISEMLANSITKVTDTVESSKLLMASLIEQSKKKIEFGTRTAHDCAQSLDEILANASMMGEMVKEISTASREQSIGINEVNRAMNDLDSLSKSNNEIASTSSTTAADLEAEANKLKVVVLKLTTLVEGKHARNRAA